MKDKDPASRAAGARLIRGLENGGTTDARIIELGNALRLDASAAVRGEAQSIRAAPKAPAELTRRYLADLRRPEPHERERAAAKLATISAFEPVAGQALLRAVREGDFASREGLILGMERALEFGVSVEAALSSLAGETSNPTKRAYARAALRAMKM